MAWCDDDLILLPQYPDRLAVDGLASVFSIQKSDLEGYFSEESGEGVQPQQIAFHSGNLETMVAGFEGFEAIVFAGQDVFVTIEARQRDGMMGYLVKGAVEENCRGVKLDPETLVPLPPQADISNMSHETLVFFDERLFVIFEANGVNINPNSEAHVFDQSLKVHSTIPMPTVEYRITDAAVPDETGAFWAINYFFSGDASDLKPGVDQVAIEYGIGRSHRDAEPVERLVKFLIDDSGVHLVDQAPIYLELMAGDSRNWEGLVQFRDGFLLVTDKFPTTILAYVEKPSMK